MIITNERVARVGYFITSYPTRAHGIIVIYFHIYCYRMLGPLKKAYFFIVLYLHEVYGFHKIKNLNTSKGCAVNYPFQSQPIYLRFTEKVMDIPNWKTNVRFLILAIRCTPCILFLALDYSVWLAHIDMYKTIAVVYNSYV